MSRRLIAGFLVAVAAVFTLMHRAQVRDLVAQIGSEPVPSAVPYVVASDTPESTPPTTAAAVEPTRTPRAASPSPSLAPRAVNLSVPFVSQAPSKVWDVEHEDFCEEAAALMAASYVRGDNTVKDIAVAEKALQAAKAWEIATFGYFESTTAAQTTQMLREHFGISAVKLENYPTQAQIVSWVTAGKVVVVPTAGRLLGNPNFTGIGPLYHYVVVKGFTANGTWITNDPGTRKGADYLYAPSVIMNAMHDWNEGDVPNGSKIVIVVG